MSTAAVVAGRLRSETWAAGVPRHAHDGCASIPGIVGWALTYVQPLPRWLDELQGDPAAVYARSADWRSVEGIVAEVAADLDAARRALDELDGRTVRALRERHGELSELLRDVQDWSGSASSALALAATLVTASRDALCGLLSALGRLAESIVGFTLNPFDKIDDIRRFADAAWDLVVLGRDLVDALLTAVAQLARLLTELAPIVQDGLITLQDLLGRMLPALSGLVGGPLGYLLSTGLGDLLRADPRVSELDPDDAADRKAYEALMARGEITSPADLIAGNGLIDRISGGDQTAISVTTVRRPDGSTYTLVNLPSTQDWGALKGLFGEDWADTFADAGAMNDLDSNIALMIMNNPVLRTQYERAVMQALSDAGVAPGSDVVWSGFSQGGIMAGNLAADGSLPYNTVGVVTNGSPIDSFDIPATIPVLQIEHVSDPVAKLDLQTPLVARPEIVNGPLGPSVGVTTTLPRNVDWVVLPDPDGSAAPGDTHNALNYERDFSSYLDQGGALNNDWSFLNGTVEEVYVARTGE